MKKLKAILIGLALTMGFVAQAQEVSPVDFMRLNPYQMKTNMATNLPYSSVMSLVIGNTTLNLQNTTLRYDNLFEFDEHGKPTVMNLRKFADGLNKKNFLGIDSNVELFTLYRSVGKGRGMLTFDWGIKVQGDVSCSDGLFKLFAYGNSAFVGDDNPADINLDLNLKAYRQFAVGYQHNVSNKFSIGVRTKLLFGLANIQTESANVKLFTDPDSYALRIKEDIFVKGCMPSAVQVKDGNLETSGGFIWRDLYGNQGFGLDLAAEFHINKHFGIVAAVNDIGFISWKANNIMLEGQVEDVGQFYDNGSFLFTGLDSDELELIMTEEDYRDAFSDSLKMYFPTEFKTGEKYITRLNTSALLRGYYDIDGMNRFIVQAQGMFYESGFRPAMTVAYNGTFFNKLDVCATYTIAPGSYDNLGLGLALRLGTFHIYATTNNIIGCFKPMNTGSMNAQVGIVFNMLKPEMQVAKKSKAQKSNESEPAPAEKQN